MKPSQHSIIQQVNALKTFASENFKNEWNMPETYRKSNVVCFDTQLGRVICDVDNDSGRPAYWLDVDPKIRLALPIKLNRSYILIRHQYNPVKGVYYRNEKKLHEYQYFVSNVKEAEEIVTDIIKLDDEKTPWIVAHPGRWQDEIYDARICTPICQKWNHVNAEFRDKILEFHARHQSYLKKKALIKECEDAKLELYTA